MTAQTPPDALDPTKWCPGCREHLPTTEFGPDTRQRDGLNNRCRDCRATAKLTRRGRQGTQPAPAAWAPTGPAVHICTCTYPIEHTCGACHCGYPIVALMHTRGQIAMDEKWPAWRRQQVTRLSDQQRDVAS